MSKIEETTIFGMQLMLPGQTNKDIVFNEALLTIDNFLSITINGFLNEIDDIEEGKKYIIRNGKYKNHICYKSHTNKEREYYLPKSEAIFFLLENRNFILYSKGTWQEMQTNYQEPISRNTYIDKKFHSISNKFRMPNNKSYFYLYLHKKATIDLNEVTMSEVTIIIKQNYKSVNTIIWPNSILWEDKFIHKITNTPNATDIIKLYKLPETQHFLGKIIAQNIQF